MHDDSHIQILDPADLVADLQNSGVSLPGFIFPIHHLFHINRIEEYTRLVNFPTRAELTPRKLTVYSFFFLIEGESRRKKGLTEHQFNAGTFFFTPAYEITTHEYISPGAKGFYAYFNMDLLTTHFHLKDILRDFPFLEFNCFPLLDIDRGSIGTVVSVLERLEREYQREEKCRTEILRAYLIALFTELKAFVQSDRKEGSTAGAVLTERYKQALASHIYEKQKVSDYAELLSVTPNHLNKSVRQTLNTSALELLHDMLLLEAKVLLKQTNLKINEIAFKIGRKEATDFARFFKRKTGISPGAYRKL